VATEAVVNVREEEQAEVGDGRMLGPWFLAVVLNSYAVTLFCVGCYDYADKVIGATASMRLWMSAAWGLAYIFISLVAGKIVEKWGARRTMLVMTALSAGSALIGVLMTRHGESVQAWKWAPALLMLVMLPFNVTSTTCWPALESAISRSAGRMRLSTRMAVYNLSWAAAGFAAFFTRGALEALGWSTIFTVPALTMAASMAVLAGFAMSREGAPKVAEETEEDTPAIRKRAVTLLHMAWVGNALAYVGINVVTAVLMKLADTAGVKNLAYGWGIEALTLIGFWTSVWGLTRVVGFVIAGKWTGWHYKARWLVGSQLALAGTFLLMMVVHNVWALLLAQIVFGLSAALIYSSSLYYAMHTSEGSGGHAGFHEALIGVGIFVGPAIGAIASANSGTGGAADLAALERIGWSVAAVLVAGAIVMWWMGAKGRGTVAKQAVADAKRQGEGA
jgi:MFS family permease